jgi:hypothetical protein
MQPKGRSFIFAQLLAGVRVQPRRGRLPVLLNSAHSSPVLLKFCRWQLWQKAPGPPSPLSPLTECMLHSTYSRTRIRSPRSASHQRFYKRETKRKDQAIQLLSIDPLKKCGCYSRKHRLWHQSRCSGSGVPPRWKGKS